LDKEAFGAENFGKLQARIFELKVVLNERKNFGDHKDGNEDEELPERAKARPEEFRMLFAAARIAKEIYISQRDDRPINTELLSEEYERVIADYDSGLEDLNELKIKSVLGNDVYKAFRLGSIPYLSNSSNLLMGVSQTVDSA
jgi:hypothetical protein